VSSIYERERRYRKAEQALWRSLGVEPDEQRVRLPRVGTTVRVQELGQGDPVVFLHGASTSGASWGSLVALLPGVRSYVVDRPGTGLSAPLGGRVRDASGLSALGGALLPDLLDALELETADVVATSFGGYFAFRGALAEPGRVRRIIEFGWSLGAPLGRMPWAMRVGTMPVLSRLATRMPVNERVVRSMFRAIGLRQAVDAGRVSSEAIRLYAALLNDTDTMRNEQELGRALVSPLRGIDRRLQLSEGERSSIRQPVRFIWGDSDVFGGPDIARDFVRPFPDARLEIVPGAGHSPWMDDAEQSAELVRRSLVD
jgi:pimeloyl-ACP methyl ester carboxylesterase